MKSFSDGEPVEELDEIRPGAERKSSNILITLLLIFAIAAVAFYAYLRSQDSDFSKISLNSVLSGKAEAGKSENAISAINEIPYDSSENAAFTVYQNYIVKAGPEGIKLWDEKGQEVWNSSVPMSKPILRTNGDLLVAADLEGLEFVVLDGKAEKWRGKAEGNIINADVSREGYVTILSNAKRYGGEAIVYDNLGIVKFKAFIANNTPLVSKISPSSHLMLVNCVNTSGAKVQTYMKLYDIGGKELAGKVIEPVNSVFPQMWFAGEEAIYLAGDTAITLLDSSGGQKWTKEYDMVYSTCMAGSRNLAAAVKDKEGIRLILLGTNGHELVSAPMDSDVRNINSNGNVIAVNTVREVHFINDRGTELGKYTSKADVREVYFMDRHEVAVLTKNSVSVINIR